MFGDLRASLPSDAGPLIREKYDGWSGVLRLWVYEGWEANAMGWLNRAISAFEKEREGVYIQARKVDAAALRDFATSGVNPPDMLLFPPGLLDGPEGLAAVGELPALRAGLATCADGYAAPVLMGGYAWVYDRQALEGPPGEADAAVCAPESAYSCPPAAWMLLLTGEREAEVELEAPGLDLGLPASAEVGTASPVNDDAYGAFTRGESPALVATQAEVRRLTALAEAGRGPDWAAAATGEAMLADQLLLAGHRRLAARGHRRAAGALPGISFAPSGRGDAGSAGHVRRAAGDRWAERIRRRERLRGAGSGRLAAPARSPGFWR